MPTLRSRACTQSALVCAVALSLGLTFAASVAAISPRSPASLSSAIPAGTVLFPNSCNGAAQQPFSQGLLALHNFEYEESAALFAQARTADPRCAIAGWGEAMAHWHPLWGAPDAEAIAAGKSAVKFAQLQQQHATARERDYIAAIAAYYFPPDGHKAIDAYTARVKTLHASYPADDEATLFYAVALIATEPDNKAHRLAQAREAGALAEAVFKAKPWHPGAAHYIIHAYDEPELAAKALPAARAYAKIAPDAPHALHMPAHIFAQLGLWQDDVASNVASYNAAHAATQQTPDKVIEQLHALDYLQYAQLQLGDFDAARQTTALAVHIAEEHPGGHSQYTRYGLAWRIPIETEDWVSVAAFPDPDLSSDKFWRAQYAWLQTIAAGELRQPARAGEWLTKYEVAEQAAKSQTVEDDAAMLLVMEHEAEAWEAFARRDGAAAIAHMQAAVKAEEDPLSGIYTRKPASEMLGDIELALNHKTEAAAAYRAALERHPHRRLSELGLKKAEE